MQLSKWETVEPRGLSTLASDDVSWTGCEMTAGCSKSGMSGSTLDQVRSCGFRSRSTTNGLHQQPTAFRVLRNVSTSTDTQRASPDSTPSLMDTSRRLPRRRARNTSRVYYFITRNNLAYWSASHNTAAAGNPQRAEPSDTCILTLQHMFSHAFVRKTASIQIQFSFDVN